MSQSPATGKSWPLALLRRAWGRQSALALVAVALFLFFALNAEHFTASRNLYEILRTSAFTIIIGLPLTYLLIVGEFDLSSGPTYGFCAVITGVAIAKWGMNPWLAVGFALALGALVGAINGLVTVGFGVPSFISTLGMSSLVGGLAIVLTGGLPVTLPDDFAGTFLSSLTGGEVARIPAQVLWAAAIFVVLGFVLRYTVFGAHCYATGGNLRAATRLGIKANRVKVICFILVGVSAALAGALTTGWLSSASPNVGRSSTLGYYAAVIIGGAAVDGGAGTATGTVLGAIIISMLRSGLVLLGVQGSWVEFFSGLLIIVVGVSDMLARPQSRAVQNLKQMTERLRAGFGGRRRTHASSHVSIPAGRSHDSLPGGPVKQ